MTCFNDDRAPLETSCFAPPLPMEVHVVQQARDEYARDGLVSVDTIILLTAEGFDADAIINEISEEKL